jgi:tRNA threonylcarbamoyladenosine biosynthesis protein TsaE
MKKPSEDGREPVSSIAKEERPGSAAFVTCSPEETIRLGRRISKLLVPGDVIALVGELGTGKTCLTKGIAQGLGVPSDQFVRSASFVIVNRYDGRYPIWHIDAYRLDGPLDFVSLGYEELIDSGCIAVIEWAERVDNLLPPRAIQISLEHIAPTERRIHIDFTGLAPDRQTEWKNALGTPGDPRAQ